MSDLTKIIIIGVLVVGAWIAIGSPTTIDDLRTDIANIQKKFSPQNPQQDQQDQGQGQQQQPDQSQQQGQQPQPSSGGGMMGGGGGGAPDMSGGGGGGAGIPSPSPSPDQSQLPTPEMAGTIASKNNDIGSTNGTAAPEPANAPPVAVKTPPPPNTIPKHPPGHPLAPPVATTTPVVHPHSHKLFLKVHGSKHNPPPPPHSVSNTKVIHNPPHAVKKTLAHPLITQQHHYFKHAPHHIGPIKCDKNGCICTDCSKCDCNKFEKLSKVKSHLAYSFNANTTGDLFSYY